MKRVFWLGLALTVACSDALEQTSSAGQVIGVVNAADNTVSFVSATGFSVRTVDLQTPGGAATTAAGRGGTVVVPLGPADSVALIDRKSTRLNSSHDQISYAVFCLKKKKKSMNTSHNKISNEGL